MRIFITGASGYIGFHVALVFRRAGHEVWGLVRRKETAKELLRNEIYPVFGTLQDSSSYLNVVKRCSVVVHAAFDTQPDAVSTDKNSIRILLSAAKEGGEPTTLIYTSGVWIYGNSGDQVIDETTPTRPAKRVAWRSSHEQMVLNDPSVHGLVMRPGCVYGKEGGLTGSWFKSALRKEEFRVIGDGSNRWAMVHVDDLATGYLLAAESGLGGEILLLADPSRSRVHEMVDAIAKVTGYEGDIRYVSVEEASKTIGDLAECLALDQQVDSSKARRLLGWQPKHLGFLQEVEVFFEAWKACAL